MYSATLTTILTLTATVDALRSAMQLPESTTNRATRSENLPDIASVMQVPPSAFVSYPQEYLPRGDLGHPAAAGPTLTATAEKRWACASSPTFTWGDEDYGGIGVTITNADGDWRAFYVYQNLCDYVPLKYLWVAAQHTVFVSLPADFQGRITRGTDEVHSS